MSHFTVLVIGNNPEEKLAPFQENNMGNCPKEYMTFHDKEEELRKDYETDTVTRVQMPDGSLKTTHDEMFRVKGSHGIGGNSHEVPAEFPKVEVSIKEIYKTFDEYASEYHGYRKDEEVGKYGYWENPNKKWDWYQLGGRWTGFFKLKSGALASVGQPGLMTPEPEDGHGDQCLKSEIDFDGMRKAASNRAAEEHDTAMGIIGAFPENETWETVRKRHTKMDEARAEYWAQPRCAAWEAARKADFKNWPFGFRVSPDEFLPNRDQYMQKAADEAITTHAIIYDGKWYERGEMGWFAIVHNEKESAEWSSEFSKMLDSLPDDTLLSVYDCHI